MGKLTIGSMGWRNRPRAANLRARAVSPARASVWRMKAVWKWTKDRPAWARANPGSWPTGRWNSAAAAPLSSRVKAYRGRRPPGGAVPPPVAARPAPSANAGVGRAKPAYKLTWDEIAPTVEVCAKEEPRAV